MGLYDSYKLYNSTAIPQFAGSVIPEIGYAKQDLDQKYDVAKSYADTTESMLGNTPYFQNSAKEFQAVSNGLNTELDAIGKRKDYEHMIPATHDLVTKAAMQLKPFADEHQRFQEAVKKLDDKDLNLDENTKQLLIRKSVQDDADARKAGVGGMYQDPITGQWKGGFQSIHAAKNVDIPKWVDERLKDAATQKYGSENVNFGNGAYMVKRGSKWESLGDKEIQSILGTAYSLSPDVQAHVEQQATLQGWAAGQKAKSFYKNLPPGSIKDAVDGMVTKGVPLKDAVQATMTAKTHSDQLNSITGYGTQKFQKNNFEGTMDVKNDEEFLQKQKLEHEDATDAGNALVTPGMTTTVQEWAKTHDGLEKGLTDIGSKITDLENQKKIVSQQAQSTDPNARAVAGMKLKSINDDLERQHIAQDQYTAIHKTNLDAATQKLRMGNTYEEVQAQVKPDVVKQVKDVIKGAGVTTAAGKSVSADEIADAFIKNNYTKNRGDITINIPDKGAVTIKGTSFDPGMGAPIAYGNRFDKAISTVTDPGSKLGRINQQAASDYQTPENLVVPGVTMSKNQIEEVHKALPSLTLYTSDGASKVAPEDDLVAKAAKIEVAGSVLQTGFVPIVVTDKDGVKTTLLADARHTGLRDNVGMNLFKTNTANPKMQQVGRDLLEGSAPDVFTKAIQPGLPINSYGGKKQLMIPTDKGLQPGTFIQHEGQFAITDPDGNILKDQNGNDLQSSDPNQIAPFFQYALGLKDAEMPHSARKVAKK